jgi:hypothetical protein
VGPAGSTRCRSHSRSPLGRSPRHVGRAGLWARRSGQHRDLTGAGISSQVRSCRRRPPDLERRPPHCLKKNATPSAAQRSRSSSSHYSRTGRCFGPLSPPPMSQSMPSRSSPSSGPRSGSALMKRTGRINLAQIIGAVDESAVLDGHAHPHVRMPVERLRELDEALVALREHLEGMPVCAAHHIEHVGDVLVGDALVEQVRHRIHEHQPRASPAQREAETLRPQLEFKALLVRVTGNAAESLGERLRVAVSAPRRHLRAARGRIPARLRPLDSAAVGHDASLLRRFTRRCLPCGLRTKDPRQVGNRRRFQATASLRPSFLPRVSSSALLESPGGRRVIWPSGPPPVASG